jgi:hypothetical protein
VLSILFRTMPLNSFNRAGKRKRATLESDPPRNSRPLKEERRPAGEGVFPGPAGLALSEHILEPVPTGCSMGIRREKLSEEITNRAQEYKSASWNARAGFA